MNERQLGVTITETANHQHRNTQLLKDIYSGKPYTFELWLLYFNEYFIQKSNLKTEQEDTKL